MGAKEGDDTRLQSLFYKPLYESVDPITLRRLAKADKHLAYF